MQCGNRSSGAFGDQVLTYDAHGKVRILEKIFDGDGAPQAVEFAPESLCFGLGSAPGIDFVKIEDTKPEDWRLPKCQVYCCSMPR